MEYCPGISVSSQVFLYDWNEPIIRLDRDEHSFFQPACDHSRHNSQSSTQLEHPIIRSNALADQFSLLPFIAASGNRLPDGTGQFNSIEPKVLAGEARDVSPTHRLRFEQTNEACPEGFHVTTCV